MRLVSKPWLAEANEYVEEGVESGAIIVSAEAIREERRLFPAWKLD